MIIFTKNDYHLGDNVFICIFFSKIIKYIEDNNIFINHYCLKEHIDQVKEFIYSKNIQVFDLNEIPNNKEIINLWIGCNEYNYNYYHGFFGANNMVIESYDIFLRNFYNNVLKMLNFPIIIENFIFDNDNLDFLELAKKINEKTNNKYINIDFLIVNSAPQSGQLIYDKNEWDRIITLFHNKYNVITTQKVENVKCTRDDNLSVKDIASISTNVKQIIAIDTGPTAGMYNKYTINNADNIYILSNHNNGITFSTYKNNIHDMMFLLE
jgi:hypothetical protein